MYGDVKGAISGKKQRVEILGQAVLIAYAVLEALHWKMKGKRGSLEIRTENSRR